MSNTIEFEPGASAPIRVRPKGAADLSSATAMLSLKIGDACFPINASYDESSQGFVFDLDDIAEHITSTDRIKAFLYIDWASGGGWVRVGSLNLKPVEGCVWSA